MQISSPVKAGRELTHSRLMISQNLQEDGSLVPDPDFCLHHLQSPFLPLGSNEMDRLDKIAKLGELIESFVDSSATSCYASGCAVLNALSDAFYRDLPRRHTLDELLFIDHHTMSLAHHPITAVQVKPDLICVTASRLKSFKSPKQPAAYKNIPWHYAETVLELKPMRDADGPSQAAAYAGFLNQARPDKPGIYALSMSPRKYEIMWSDPSGLYISESFEWDNVWPLASYVNSLYTPASGHLSFDPSITLVEPKESAIYGRPRWTIRYLEETYNNCEVLFVGRPWTRMSWVARSGDASPSVIKDSYRSVGRRWGEGQLFDLLHEDNPVPGWMQIRAHGAVMLGDARIMTPVLTSRRFKERLVMSSYGDSIYECSNVRDFLKVMYDILEAHRWAFENRKILHRDISIRNILINPAGATVQLDGSRPKYIDEIIDGTSRAPSTALLFDLDNGCEYDPRGAQVTSSLATDTYSNDEDTQPLKDRTGTPMYISRSVASGTILVSSPAFDQMPIVHADVRLKYESVHADDPYRGYTDDFDDPDQYHGGTFDKRLFRQVQSHSSDSEDPSSLYFYHQPRHDAESVYWVMVAFLLRALPARSIDAEDRHHEALSNAWKCLANHTIGSGHNNSVDPRAPLLEFSHLKWAHALHEDLTPLAGLLLQAGIQVAPEYTYLKPHPPRAHLHEAMQRLLLNQIWAMKDDPIPLVPGILRAVKVVHERKERQSSQPSAGSEGLKRSSEEPSGPRKRQRTFSEVVLDSENSWSVGDP